MTFANAVVLQQGPQLDAFGRQRVSDLFTIFDSKQIFDNQPLFWDELLESGSGISSAHSTDTASTVLTSTINTAGKFTRQTFMRLNYQPGKSQLVRMTGILDRSGGGTGVQRRIGLFDDNNGLFFEERDGTVYVVRRTNVTGTPAENEVAQSSWSKDHMDGTGSSGVTIDWTKAQQFEIDFEWLGVGPARMSLVVGGELIVVHRFLGANVLDKVYMSTPNLPLRVQMITTGSSPASTMENMCATVQSEGGREELGTLRSKSTAGTHVDADTQGTLYAIVGIRLKSTHLGATINMISASIAEHAGGNNMEWSIILNGTVAGTPGWADETNSAVQTFTGVAANTVTGGTVITSGHFTSTNKGGANGSALKNALLIGAKIDGTVDECVLCARPIGGSVNTDVEGSLSWREEP